MRVLFGCVAVLLGLVSISLAARYGYKGADTTIDGVISAVVYGAIALCAFLFDTAAVRLWFQGHRVGSGAIGLIAAAALVVTFTNSLGAIAGRADITLAQQTRAADNRIADQRDLVRLEKTLAGLGNFIPTDEQAVEAAKRAADTATSNRVAECDKRGPNCRARELDEQTAASQLATATAAKPATDRARQLEAEIRRVRARLDAGEPIGNPNPLGNALALLLGEAASVLTAWQQAIVAAVFEFCLVGVMVIYELLGHAPQPAQQHRGDVTVEKVARMAKPRGRIGTTAKSVKSYVHEQVFPADEGDRVEVKTLMQDYRAWCTRKGLMPIALAEFLDEIEKLFGKLGIEIKVGDDQRVYCLKVKIGGAIGTLVGAVH
jgi:hypothetical protein